MTYYKWNLPKAQLEQKKNEYVHLLRNTKVEYLKKILPLMIQDLQTLIKRDDS